LKDSVMITKGQGARFLIINPFGIGDVLFTTPVIRNLKNNFPGCFVGYWCNKRVEPILARNPDINKTFALSRGDLKKILKESKLRGIKEARGLFGGLKKNKFDCAIDFSLDHRYGLISRLAGIKKRIGYDYKGRGRFLTEKLILSSYTSKHAVEYYLDLLKIIGVNPKPLKLELFTSEEDRLAADKLLKDCGITYEDSIIGFAPGGGESWGKDSWLKRWPAENFGHLINKVSSGCSAKTIIFGDSLDADLVERIRKVSQKPFVNLCGRTTLETLAALIARLDILITNDGGPLHMASALGIKTLSFFGPTDPDVYGPYPFDKDRHVVLRKGFDCIPCYENFRLESCTLGYKCLKDITPDEAYEGFLKLYKK
jgi:heptosyltransferase II